MLTNVGAYAISNHIFYMRLSNNVTVLFVNERITCHLVQSHQCPKKPERERAAVAHLRFIRCLESGPMYSRARLKHPKIILNLKKFVIKMENEVV